MVLTVVFPAYNEEASVQKVVLDHVRVLNQLGDAIDDWEMVCVDDASSDRTREILAELAKQVPKLRVLSHTENLGIFSSYADLFSAARGTHIYLTASDGQWPAENLLKMLPAVVGGADLVVGVRQNRGEVYSLSRRAISFLFNLLPLLLFGVKTSDAGSI